MNSNTRHILTLCITTLLMFGLFAAILPLSFGIGEELAWHEQIMANTTFNNLADPGETLLIVYEANGNYSNGVTDTHNYLIYRIDEAGLRDLQAHIELAKVGNNTYQMEIYHSVPNWKFSFEMPYTHTVQIETRYLITLIIEAILNPASTPTGFFTTNGTTDSNPGGLEWHEQIMANTSFYGLMGPMRME
jgi:hypothetical protein